MTPSLSGRGRINKRNERQASAWVAADDLNRVSVSMCLRGRRCPATATQKRNKFCTKAVISKLSFLGCRQQRGSFSFLDSEGVVRPLSKEGFSDFCRRFGRIKAAAPVICPSKEQEGPTQTPGSAPPTPRLSQTLCKSHHTQEKPG